MFEAIWKSCEIIVEVMLQKLISNLTLTVTFSLDIHIYSVYTKHWYNIVGTCAIRYENVVKDVKVIQFKDLMLYLFYKDSQQPRGY